MGYRMRFLSILSIYLILCSSGCGILPQTGTTTPQIPDLSLPATDTAESSGEETTEVSEDVTSSDAVPPLMSPPAGDERIVGVALGELVPFTGVLLNEAAAAWLESEADAVQERCQLFVTRRVGELRARLAADTERLELRISTLTEINSIEIRARNERIESLLRMNEELRNRGGEWWEEALWVGGALILGIAAGIIIGFVAN
jgi:hypothetical protein